VGDVKGPVDLRSAVESRKRSLRSRIYGRDRWEVPGILGNVRAAASLKALLESEAGIRRVVANDATGRVLVEYTPSELTDSVEALLNRALDFGPMSPSEFNALHESKSSVLPALRALASAESTL